MTRRCRWSAACRPVWRQGWLATGPPNARATPGGGDAAGDLGDDVGRNAMVGNTPAVARPIVTAGLKWPPLMSPNATTNTRKVRPCANATSGSWLTLRDIAAPASISTGKVAMSPMPGHPLESRLSTASPRPSGCCDGRNSRVRRPNLQRVMLRSKSLSCNHQRGNRSVSLSDRRTNINPKD